MICWCAQHSVPVRPYGGGRIGQAAAWSVCSGPAPLSRVRARASAAVGVARVGVAGGSRAGTAMRCRRSVAPRATACRSPASVPAARSRLYVIAVQMAQAAFDGELAGGQVRQRAVDDVGQDGLDDGVLAVGDVGLRG